MTNHRYAVLASLLIGIIVLAACNAVQRSAEINAELNTPFQLKIGQSARLDSQDLSVAFLEVTEDSRCPEDAECIVAGQVSTLISVSENDIIQSDYKLTIGPGGDDAVVNVPSGFTIQLIAVAPHPTTSQPIKLADYIATFLVSVN